jgi:hypothetical protein
LVLPDKAGFRPGASRIAPLPCAQSKLSPQKKYGKGREEFSCIIESKYQGKGEAKREVKGA